MSKTIKFRAWDKLNKKIVTSGLSINIDTTDRVVPVSFTQGDIAYCRDNGVSLGPNINSDIELMQFTGLTDRHGVEIYEGDIVARPYIDPLGGIHEETEGGRHRVGFEHGQFVVFMVEARPLIDWCEKRDGEYVSNYGNLTLVSDTTVLEVIGNIYVNSELLEEKL